MAVAHIIEILLVACIYKNTTGYYMSDTASSYFAGRKVGLSEGKLLKLRWHFLDKDTD